MRFVLYLIISIIKMQLQTITYTDCFIPIDLLNMIKYIYI